MQKVLFVYCDTFFSIFYDESELAAEGNGLALLARVIQAEPEDPFNTANQAEKKK